MPKLEPQKLKCKYSRNLLEFGGKADVACHMEKPTDLKSYGILTLEFSSEEVGDFTY